MFHCKMPIGILAAAGVLSMGVASLALGSTVTLSDTTLSTGTTGPGTNTQLAVPGSFTYADTFGAGVGGTAVAGTNNGFFDDFIFSIAGGTADSLTSTINLGSLLAINGLQVSLFSYTPGEALPLFGTTLPPGTQEIDAWSSPISAGGLTGTVSVIPATQLNAGSYVLEVRGTVTGSAGGSYSGVLNLAPATPVPLPAALPLLLSGLGGLGLWGRRRAKA
jgi:hypothetical protein